MDKCLREGMSFLRFLKEAASGRGNHPCRGAAVNCAVAQALRIARLPGVDRQGIEPWYTVCGALYH